jgi:hypothetical protein
LPRESRISSASTDAIFVIVSRLFFLRDASKKHDLRAQL